jgi:hypothetical protein
LGTHGEKGFHGRSLECSELIIGDIRISGGARSKNNLPARKIRNALQIKSGKEIRGRTWLEGGW